MLSLEHVDVFYGEVKALDDVNIEINTGEFVCLIGANGAGKSTLLNTISGILEPKKGKILYNGEDISGMRPEFIVRRGIVQIPEGRQLFTGLTVEENLMMGAYLLKNKQEIKDNLENVYTLFNALKVRRSKLSQTLSGGEQQMLAVGRALMASPKMLIIDEPSLGIAPILVEQIFEVIKELNSRGLSILLVEQNIIMALKNSTRGYVIERGKVVLSDSSENLLKNKEVEKAYLGI